MPDVNKLGRKTIRWNVASYLHTVQRRRKSYRPIVQRDIFNSHTIQRPKTAKEKALFEAWKDKMLKETRHDRWIMQRAGWTYRGVGWCQDAWARLEDGTPCSIIDPNAKFVDMSGAILRTLIRNKFGLYSYKSIAQGPNNRTATRVINNLPTLERKLYKRLQSKELKGYPDIELTKKLEYYEKQVVNYYAFQTIEANLGRHSYVANNRTADRDDIEKYEKMTLNQINDTLVESREEAINILLCLSLIHI